MLATCHKYRSIYITFLQITVENIYFIVDTKIVDIVIFLYLTPGTFHFINANYKTNYRSNVVFMIRTCRAIFSVVILC